MLRADPRPLRPRAGRLCAAGVEPDIMVEGGGRRRERKARSAEADDGEWPLLRELRRCIKDFGLIAPGDRICVAVSGGKDSSTLAYLLQQIKLRRMLPFDDWSFVAVHLDQVQPGHDASPLMEWLAAQGVH